MSRREEVKRDLGLTTSEEKEEIEVALSHEEIRRQKKEKAKELLEKEPSYKLVKGISKLFDKYFVDGILGFVVPEIGDILTGVLALPFLYVSMFKIKSLALTLAVLYNTLLDCLIGLVPWVGDALDFFHRAYSKNYALIVGYVEDDEKIIKKVKRDAVKSAVGIAVFAVACYFLFKAVYIAISTFYGVLGCKG
ncbi:MAG: DUF4112 domain-containing protein [Bacteroidales bacterium]|nr:DUF4112 domain-containing protein [Bacteroidales bacterium]